MTSYRLWAVGPMALLMGLVVAPALGAAPPGVAATGGGALMSSPAPWKPDPSAQRGHVGSWVKLGDTIFMIWGAVRTSIMPKSAEVTPDGKRVIVAHIGRRNEKNLGIYQAIPLKFERWIDYEGSAIEVAFSGDGRTMFATNMHRFGFLDFFDMETLEHKRHLRVHGFPKIIVPGPQGRYLYLAMWVDNGVARVDMNNWTVKYMNTRGKSRYRKHPPSKNPRGMAITADGQSLYIANNADRSVSIVDVPSFKDRKKFNIGSAPRHVVRSRDDKHMFVSMSGENAVAMIDVETEKVVRRYRVGHRPKGIALSHDGRFLYSADYMGHSMTAVDLESGEKATLPINLLKTSGLGVHPSDDFIYITGWCTYELWAIQRIDPGESPLLPLGWDKPNDPCYDCPSSYMACPKKIHR